jgi:uncharacterized protein (TIGR00269 family)
MLEYGDNIAVAVSGGKDSISLLHILAKIERKFPKASLYAITIDEGIQKYRDEALKFAIDNCKKLGIDHYIISFKELYGYSLDEIIKKIKNKYNKRLSPCAYCGIMRRNAINIAARKVKAEKLATAHTIDDEIQTIMLNIFNGNVQNIARQKPVTDKSHPKFVQKIKPLCEILEKEIALYAYIQKIPFQNLPCPYAGEALRNDVRTMLNRIEEKHAGIKYTIFKSIEKIRPALKKGSKIVKLKECTKCGEPTTGKVCNVCAILDKIN